MSSIKQFQTANDIRKWCSENGYQLMDFYNGSGDIKDKTGKIGTWEKVSYGFNVFLIV